MAKIQKKRKLKQKLIDKYRLVILNEDTFQEKFSLKLSLLNVFVFGGIFSILLISFTTLLIAFTGLREYIPGYSSSSLKRKATQLIYQADSLKMRLAVIDHFVKAVQPVLTGEISPDKIDSIRVDAQNMAFYNQKLAATKEDSLFREKVERKNRFPLLEGVEGKTKVVFFSPLTGSISQDFSRNDKHYAIDIVAKKGIPVKVIADGTVILAEWTAETGYVIAVQHADEFISIYKHNGTLLKEQGDVVKSGEAIASVGATGELSTGPHLHFELWNNGIPVNPKDYIDFQ